MDDRVCLQYPGASAASADASGRTRAPCSEAAAASDSGGSIKAIDKDEKKLYKGNLRVLSPESEDGSVSARLKTVSCTNLLLLL